MSLSIVTINARGLRNNIKRKALFLFAKQHNYDFCFVQESHSVPNDDKFWRSQWGNEIWQAHGTKYSAGVTTLKHNFSGNTLLTKCDASGHFVLQVVSIANFVMIIINIYGYNSHSDNSILLDTLEKHVQGISNNFPVFGIIMGGDFNMILDHNVDCWPPRNSNAVNINLKLFMQKFNLIDVWRQQNLNTTAYTWSNRSATRHSRLDFWLISNNLNIDKTSVNILTTPLTDHSAVAIFIPMHSSIKPCKSSYWKLNCLLLKHVTVKSVIKRLIAEFWYKACSENNYSKNWELFKFKAAQYLRTHGSTVTKNRRQEEERVISSIMLLSQKHPSDLSEKERLDLTSAQLKLNEIYLQKAKGAFIRSRKKWIEAGEQNSAYFFNLEKHHGKLNLIQHLNINGVLTDDPKKIAHFCSSFYSNLYKTKYCHQSSTHFFNSLSNVAQITDKEKEICDDSITLQEVISAINHLKTNKSPGVDGLPAEFYQTFIEDLSPFILEVILESIERETLPPTLTQGLITLIPKPKKDHLLIDNWRPISLLNTDYKVFASILAKRLKNVLDPLIDETQSGFMKNRHISNNIRLVLDVIDYSFLCPDDSFIFFLDFYKAFDTVEHKFIFQTIEQFGFGEFFCKAVKTLYFKGNSSIKLKDGTSPRFELQRGIRQGCPASPYLFILCTQLLSSHIKNSPLKGISIADREIIISQLADDTTLFLKNSSQVPIAIQTIDLFSSASGLCLNLKKCELFPIKDCNDSLIYNIPIKNKLTYLGITVMRNQKDRCFENFNIIIEKSKKKLNQWLQRDLSLKGRILLTKAEGLSRLTYAAIPLSVNKQICTAIDKLLFNFIWKNKTHYVKKSVIMNNYASGGLNFLDFTTLNNTFKINWIKQFLHNPTSTWNFIPRFVFSAIGGLEYVLLCDYKIEKLPVQLANFHKQMLLAWSLIYKHNFSPHRCFIWNNQYIKYKNKSIFFTSWFDNNIILVTQLLNDNGNLLTYSEFLQTFGIPVTPKDFAIVMDAVPSSILMLLRSVVKPTKIPFFNPSATPVGRICFSVKSRKNNCNIRSLFQSDITTIPYVTHYWSNTVSDLNWSNVWNLPYRYLLINKVREVSYKLIHRYYPAKQYMLKFKKDIYVYCSLCDSEPETVIHLFWHCRNTVTFWKEVTQYVQLKIDFNFCLSWSTVLFGVHDVKSKNQKQMYIINLIILLGKYHIHKSKFSNTTPSFLVFKKELEQYIINISDSNNKKAIKTIDLCTLFNVCV
uniref:Reverse transcriptase domain-containing protein n=1 Tax=Kryptolebias marmoratus TaxID=37003 RepID=A0A3Q3AHM4_KRYMA